ncbi:MAG: GNAT family N-acetyltransferase [Proteobacteria bacterium]|nr:GNAT family N-acetyltransferase [Pseudomonadota bacterium]
MALGPALEGARVALRPVTAADVGPLYLGWLNDPEINRFLESRHRESSEDSVRAFVDRVTARDGDYLFAIRLAPDGRHIGNVRLGPIRAEHRLAELSLYIGDRAAWGRGYGGETVALVTRFAFEALHLNKTIGRSYAANEASIRAFLRAGYRQEGRLRAHYLLDGKPMDLVVMGCTAGDYRARASGYQALHTTR